MDDIVIKSLGLISRLGNCEEEVLYNMENEKYLAMGKLNFENILNSRKSRRMNRIAKMLTCTISNCINNAKQELSGQLDSVGVIANTSYGPISTTNDFANTIINDKPELASPMNFANTVYNAMVGHACVYFNLKGPSTLLMAGNSILYTTNLLKKKAANYILTCGVEEYFEPVYEYEKKKYSQEFFCEGIGSILLSNQGESEYGYIIGNAETGIGYSPLYSLCMDESVKIEKMIKMAIKNAEINAEDIDCVFFASDKYSGLREYEEIAVDKIFESRVHKMYIKDLIGETLGASTTLSVAIASIAMRAGKYKKVLILGIEVSGTLEAFVLSCNRKS